MNLSQVSLSTAEAKIHRVQSEKQTVLTDTLAVEEPLEIRLECGSFSERIKKSISITMRTPGHDFELALGFLFTEGIIRAPADVMDYGFCGPSGNVVRIALNPDVQVDIQRLERHFYTSSSCGVCGKSSLAALRVRGHFQTLQNEPRVSADLIHRLPQILRSSQDVFDRTGGLHASAVFTREGCLEVVREDVGRHNALDKVIGHAFFSKQLPLDQALLLVSGRASFELVQKAAMAGIAFFAAVGAPSTLAVELAKDVGMTLLGFVRDDRFNIYNAENRVIYE